MGRRCLIMAVAGVLLLAAREANARNVTDGEVRALYRQAEALRKAARWAEAAKVYEEIVEKARAVYGPTAVSTALLMNNLADLYIDLGQHAKSERLFKESLSIREAKLGKDHAAVAVSLNNLASLYKAMGQHARAEPLLKRSLAIKEAKLDTDPGSVATSLNNLADLYNHMGQLAKAEPLLLRSLEISEAHLGKDHPKVAATLNNLAGLYKDMGQYTKAEPLYQLSLERKEAKLGKHHPSVAISLNNLAGLYQDMAQPAKAEPLLLRSLDIYESKLGKNHLFVADSLNGLGVLYQNMGQYAKAEALYLRSLEIKEATLGKDHPDVATALNNLAVLSRDLGRPAKAKALFKRGLKIKEATLGKDHPDVAITLNNLATLSAATDELAEASRLFDRARRGARRHIASVLPVLSDADKAAFFTNTHARSNLELALSLGLTPGGDADLAALSATWLVNGKGIDQESLAASALLTRQSNDAALGQLTRRLLSVRQQLARLSFVAPRPGQDKERLRQIEELAKQEQDLARKLRLAGSQAALPDWVELAQVRQALPADAVLIDVAHMQAFDFKGKPGKQWQAARYAAWVTARSGSVRVVDLGPAAQIDTALRAFRQAMQSAGKAVKEKGEEQAEKTVRQHLEALAKLVLTPLLPYVGKSKQWLISPDGNLWLLPFEALTLADGEYAVEAHEIRYLTSGRDLLPAVASRIKPSAPLVLADPDFDLALVPGPRKVLGDVEGTRSMSGAMRLGKVRRLPGTAAEAKAITPGLNGYAGMAARVCTGARAREDVVKAARSPRVLVLSTHGFFLPDQETPREEKPGPGKAKSVKRWENPLLRCGLLLAGCNKPSKASAGDDGVLTGLEVVGTDLRGCEMVVLSACETGLGEVQSGEGVAGLRQAFQLAGAKAVVSTLWQVPDRESARLMALFFENLSKGMSKAQALRAAKLKLIVERRDDFAAAHPFFWAAFTLTGQP